MTTQTLEASYEQTLAYALAEGARRRQYQAGEPLAPYPPCYACASPVTGSQLTTTGQAVTTHTIALTPCGHELHLDEQTVTRLADVASQPTVIEETA